MNLRQAYSCVNDNSKFRGLKKYKWVLVLLSINLVVFYRWFVFSILTWGDWGFHFARSMAGYPFIWNPQSQFGTVNLAVTGWPLYFLYGLVGIAGQNSNIADKVLLFIPMVLIWSFSSYLLIEKITKSRIAAFVGSLVYVFNSAALLYDTGILTVSMAFALFPIILLFFIKTLEEKSYRFATITALLSFVATWYEVRAFYIIAWVLVFYALYHTLVMEEIRIRQFVENGLLTFFTFAIIGLLNSYWILSILHVGSLNPTGVVGRGLFGVGYMNLQEALAFFHPFWTGGAPSLFKVMPIPPYFWAIPVAAFAGAFLQRRNRIIPFFGLVSLLGILLTKQESQPFPGLYIWLYDHLPGFGVFRESSMFYILIALGYSVLIGSLVEWLWYNWTKIRWQVYGKFVLTTLIAIVFLWNTKFLITGAAGSLFVPRHIPRDYQVLKDFVLNQPGYFRTYWLPQISRWGIYTNNHPEISGVDAVQSDWKFLADYQQSGNSQPGQDQIVSILNKPYSEQLFDSASIKYVIVPLQDTANDDNFYVNYGNSRGFYLQTLDNIPWLRRINIGTNQLAIYENKGFQPHVTAVAGATTLSKLTNPALSFAKMQVPKNISYMTESPTEQSVGVNGASRPFVLNFSESFNSDWQLYLQPINETPKCRPTSIYRPQRFSSPSLYGVSTGCESSSDFTDWANVLSGKTLPLNSTHIEMNGYSNGWIVNPTYIKAHFSSAYYHKNPDGSIDVNLQIYFKPQSYLYTGLGVSGLTLIGCLVYLGYSYRRRESDNVTFGQGRNSGEI